MKRLPFAALAFAVLCASACFAPRPCTQALCPSRVDGAYQISGWNSSVTAGGDQPAPPIVSDSQVTVTKGTVEFVNGKSVVKASEGASFRFEIAPKPSKPIPSIQVSSGTVSVSLSSGPAQDLTAGSTFFLPLPK